MTDITKDGAVVINLEGHGKGALVPMTAQDWVNVIEAQAAAELLGTEINSIGVFEDGSVITYTENDKGTKAVVAVAKKDGKDVKTWAGNATTSADGKETVTDDKTGETFNYTWTENKADGYTTIDADGYGKAVTVKMTVADWMILDEMMSTSKPATK